MAARGAGNVVAEDGHAVVEVLHVHGHAHRVAHAAPAISAYTSRRRAMTLSSEKRSSTRAWQVQPTATRRVRVLEKPLDHPGQSQGVAPRHEEASGRVDDLAYAAHVVGDDRPGGGGRLHGHAGHALPVRGEDDDVGGGEVGTHVVDGTHERHVPGGRGDLGRS